MFVVVGMVMVVVVVGKPLLVIMLRSQSMEITKSNDMLVRLNSIACVHLTM